MIPSSPDALLEPGTQLGSFVLVEPRRTEGSTERWRARRTEAPERPLDLLVSSGATDSISAFLDRAKALATLRHPNLVRVFGAQATGGRAFAVMDAPHGVPLDGLLRFGPLSEAAALSTIRDVAQGLELLHAQGLSHGAVRSPWVYVTTDGRCRLGGFGACLSGDPSIEEDRDAVAVLAWTLLTGRLPTSTEGVDLGDGRLAPSASGWADLEDAPIKGVLRGMLHPQNAEGRPDVSELLRHLDAEVRTAHGQAELARRAAEVSAPVSLLDEETEGSPTVLDGEGSLILGDPTYPEEVVRGSEKAYASKLTDPTFPDYAPRIAEDDNSINESVLDPTTVEAGSEVVYVEAPVGVIPSEHLPQHESVTEVDLGRAGSEDPATVSVLAAFGAEASERGLVPTPSQPSDTLATPSDRLARFDRLRVPSRSEIDAAVRGVPTMTVTSRGSVGGPALSEEDRVPEPTVVPDDTAPIALPRVPSAPRAGRTRAEVAEPVRPVVSIPRNVSVRSERDTGRSPSYASDVQPSSSLNLLAAIALVLAFAAAVLTVLLLVG